MNKAFCVLEFMIALAIIVTILAIAVPLCIEKKNRIATGSTEVVISDMEVVGKTFMWSGNKIVVTAYGDNGNYYIVIMPSNPTQSPVVVHANRKLIKEAYALSLKTSKVEQ